MENLQQQAKLALDKIGAGAQLKELRRQNIELSQNCMHYAAELEKANAIIAAKDTEIAELKKPPANRHERRAAKAAK